MVDLDTPPARKKDPATRSAALWATVIAVPVALLVGLVVFWQIVPHGDDSAAEPAASASAPAAVPSAAVQMTAPKLTARTTQVCLAVTSQLPGDLRGMPARKVSA